MLLNFVDFEPRCSYKIILIKNKSLSPNSLIPSSAACDVSVAGTSLWWSVRLRVCHKGRSFFRLGTCREIFSLSDASVKCSAYNTYLPPIWSDLVCTLSDKISADKIFGTKLEFSAVLSAEFFNMSLTLF